MSGPIVRTGTNPKFWKNWDNIFGDKASGTSSKTTSAGEKKTAKATKAAAKKGASKKAAPAKKAASKAARKKK